MNQEKVIWVAIAFSTFVYLGVAYTLAPTPALPFEESVRGTFALVFYAVAFAIFITALVVPGLNPSLPRRTKMILAMALFEACAIMGLMAAILQKDWRLFIPPWIAALIGFFREWPGGEVSSPAA